MVEVVVIIGAVVGTVLLAMAVAAFVAEPPPERERGEAAIVEDLPVTEQAEVYVDGDLEETWHHFPAGFHQEVEWGIQWLSHKHRTLDVVAYLIHADPPEDPAIVEMGINRMTGAVYETTEVSNDG